MNDYEIRTYPKSRLATFDVGKIGRDKHHIMGLLEVDVSSAMEQIERHRQSGREIGFTSWIIKAIARTVADNPHIHAVNGKRRTQVLFKNVDVSLPVEREVHGVKVPLVATIRNADAKSIDEIHGDIQSFKRQRVESEKDYVLGKRGKRRWSAFFFKLPQWIRLRIWRVILRNPFSVRRHMGTVMVTNIGFSGNVCGWIVPKSLHNLVIGLGSISKKPCVRDGELVVGDILHMTLMIDHDVVDGAPAARFAAKLVENLENGIGL